MRYVFIVNPRAGAKNVAEETKRSAIEFFKNKSEQLLVYETTGAGNATEIAQRECDKGDAVRIYGFGGDGTLLEIARGCVNMPQAEVGIFPTGSGNDYVRSYGEATKFLDLENQVNGKSITVDMINTLGGNAINICSVGFDAKVAYEMTSLKKMPGIKGSMAYDMALVKSLASKLGDDLSVQITTEEGIKKFSGKYLFALAASGTCYGGGYIGAPKAITNDGLLDFVLIKVPPFYKFPKMIGLYKKGLHIESDFFKNYLIYCRGTKMEITGKKDVYCNRDGECTRVRKEVFTVDKQSVNFILPMGIEY